jgi:hypothetical protein
MPTDEEIRKRMGCSKKEYEMIKAELSKITFKDRDA